jgi:glycosyltransferase involved in cell wall biosynthesis
VGRLGIEKNLHLLKGVLDSFANKTTASKSGNAPKVSLALVGHGPQENELKDLFKTYPNVHFAGQLTGSSLLFEVIAWVAQTN